MRCAIHTPAPPFTRSLVHSVPSAKLVLRSLARPLHINAQWDAPNRFIITMYLGSIKRHSGGGGADGRHPGRCTMQMTAA